MHASVPLAENHNPAYDDANSVESKNLIDAIKQQVVFPAFFS